MTVNLTPYFLIIFLSISLGLCATEPVQAESKLQKQSELKVLQKKIKELQSTIAVKQDSKSKTIKQLRIIEKSIGSLNVNIKNSSRSILSSKNRLKKLHIAAKKLTKSLAINNLALEKQIYGAYTQGQNSQLQMIFNQQDPAHFQRQLMFYKYLTEQQSDIINAVNLDILAMEATRKKINSETKQLEDKKRQFVSQKNSLSNDRSKRKKIVSLLSKELKKQGNHLKSLNDDAKQLKQLITSINEIFKNSAQPKTPFANLKGKLPWPLKGKLKTMFGHLKPLSNLKWQGNVIYAKEGSHIRAISSGIVAYADWLKGFGNLIIINHSDGYLSLYSHNQSLFKAAGEEVSKGEIISSAGNSGGLKKSGLYFEIRKKGKPQNPAIWCNSKNNFIS